MSVAAAIDLIQQRAYERGQEEATSISLGYSNYGACDSAIVALPFDSFLELRRAIRARRWYRYSGPGQQFAGNCKLIMIHRGDEQKTAILLCSISYDV